jgi:hypothetical protein
MSEPHFCFACLEPFNSVYTGTMRLTPAQKTKKLSNFLKPAFEKGWAIAHEKCHFFLA